MPRAPAPARLTPRLNLAIRYIKIDFTYASSTGRISWNHLLTGIGFEFIGCPESLTATPMPHAILQASGHQAPWSLIILDEPETDM